MTTRFIPSSERGRVTLDVLDAEKTLTLPKTLNVLVIVSCTHSGESHPSVIAAKNAMAAAHHKGVPVCVVYADHGAARLFRQLATQLITLLPDYRYALGANFAWMRHYLTTDVIQRTTVQNAAIGLMFFVPGADLPAMLLNQGKMVFQLATIYDKPLDIDRAKELIVVLIAGFSLRFVARACTRKAPSGTRWLIKAAVGAAGTYALGHLTVRYYEHGPVRLALPTAAADSPHADITSSADTEALPA